MTETERFEQFDDITEVNIWFRDSDDGIIRVSQLNRDFTVEINGDMLVIEETE